MAARMTLGHLQGCMGRARCALAGLLAALAACAGESAKSRGGGARAGASGAGAGDGALGGSDGEAGAGDGGEGAVATGGAGPTGGVAGVTAGGGAGRGGRQDGGEGGTAGSGSCFCTGLTGVLPDAAIECVNGRCMIEPDDCRPLRGDCDGVPEDGCEAQLDVDLSNCGACGVACPRLARCNQGNCEFPACEPGHGRCDENNACIPLDTESNCGACGRRACTFENTIATCSSTQSTCLPPVCRPGYANCSGDSACETTIITSSSAGCHPVPLTSDALDIEGSEIGVAVGGDGAAIVAGYFTSRGDFDPTGGVDFHSPTNDEYSAFMSRYTATGAYAGTLTLDGGPSTIRRVAIASDGSIFAAGVFRGAVDLDPGPGESLHGSGDAEQAFVLGLHADGSFAWARSFPTSGTYAYSSAADLALDANGAVYASGSFSGSVDFDPGASGGELVSEPGTFKPFVAKYTSSGAFDWVWSPSGECESSADRVSVHGGRVWVAGYVTGSCRFDEAGTATTAADANGDFVLALSGDRSITSFGMIDQVSFLARIASSASSTFLVGFAERPLDLDPGPAVDRRIMPNRGAFAVKFAEDGAFLWSQTFAGFVTYDAAPTRAGDLLISAHGAVGGVVFLLKSDASPGFTLDLGANRSPHALAAGGGVLAVVGDRFDAVGSKYFLARYAFEAD